MDIVFLCIVIFVFLLAIFDLSVGVSNDAVNFLNSAIGAKAARFRTIIIVAAVGVFMGAAMSNGMMDIARHGIFRPEHFSFYELTCIFMAVMVTDIILLDVFNTLGMPTSTTVSMVFELLGATFALSLVKISADAGALTFTDLLNTEKALSVILGIFLSVAIAFFFGTVVQYVSRLLFTFNYQSRLRWKAGLFGGVAITSIIYFLLIKGLRNLTLMTPEVNEWIHAHTLLIVGGCLVFFTVLMQLLHWCHVNVFKVIVLSGTFALAMAFAGNDLVNFIGVPLAGYSSFMDYTASGATSPHDFMMTSLNEPARTPIVFLIGAGVIMVASLTLSKKAYRVVKTSVDLARQDSGEEMFGSSRMARTLVRIFLGISARVVSITPGCVRRWVNRRFRPEGATLPEGAAFDLVRASVNLVLSGLLIAVGTSLKLPLSTTYVTFMVAMGTSLADRAWGRESAVFRITGVLSVIGGWFITAGVAFIGAGIIVSLLFFGGKAVLLIAAAIAIAVLLYNNLHNCDKDQKQGDDPLFHTILACNDRYQVWQLLRQHMAATQGNCLSNFMQSYGRITDGFIDEDIRTLRRTERTLNDQKDRLKANRRKETLCLRRTHPDLALENSTWFHLSANSQLNILYSLRRMSEICREHVDNNFTPLPAEAALRFRPLRNRVEELFETGSDIIREGRLERAGELRAACDDVKDRLGIESKDLLLHIQRDEPGNNMTVDYVYLNLLQETSEMVSQLRHLLRADRHLLSPSKALAESGENR